MKCRGLLSFGILLIGFGGFLAGCDAGPPVDFNYPYDKYAGITLAAGESPVVSPRAEITITSPDKKNITADAFVTIQGFVDTSADKNLRALIEVSKNGSWDYTTYLVEGNFTKDFWLRFGSGDYTISVCLVRIDADLDGEGALNTYQYLSWRDYEFQVTNTRDEDGSYFYPSDLIQSDDPDIAGLARNLTEGITREKTAIFAIHDYVVKYLYYDMDSLEDGRRKKQDAISVLENKMALCEGYTTFFNALLRSVGIPAAYTYGPVSGGGWHAWSYVKYGDAWKYVDVTWDDPLWKGHNDYPDGDNLQHTWILQDSLQEHTVHAISNNKQLKIGLPIDGGLLNAGTSF